MIKKAHNQATDRPAAGAHAGQNPAMIMSTTINYAPHELRVMQEKTDLDEKRIKLRTFIEDRPKFFELDAIDRAHMVNQLAAMNAYSAALSQRIARFVPQSAHPAVAAMQPLSNDGTAAADPDDFPLGKACDLSGDGTCEACQ